MMKLMKLLESELYRQDLYKVIRNLPLTNLERKSIFVTRGLGLICSAVADLLLACDKVEIYVGARNQKQF